MTHPFTMNKQSSFSEFHFSKMGDVEQLRIDLDKFCSTEESNQNKFENIPSESKSFNCPFWGNSRAFEITLILATLETVLIKIASNGEMPFDFEWKQISQLVKRKILYCIDSMNTKVRYAFKNNIFTMILGPISTSRRIYGFMWSSFAENGNVYRSPLHNSTHLWTHSRARKIL